MGEGLSSPLFRQDSNMVRALDLSIGRKVEQLAWKLAGSCFYVHDLTLDLYDVNLFIKYLGFAGFSAAMRVEKLSIHVLTQGHIAETLPRQWHEMPRLTGLHLSGEPSTCLLRYFSERCPMLQTISCDFNPGLDPLIREFPAGFVSRTTDWRIGFVRELFMLVDLYPSFGPETIRYRQRSLWEFRTAAN